jgi:hypothetical protein
LLVSTEPVAASTAGEVKFSDAMSWIVETWRSNSSPMSRATSGSVSSQAPKGDPPALTAAPGAGVGPG